MIYGVFVTGLLLLLVSFILPTIQYRVPAQIMAVILLLGGAHFNGAHSERALWQNKMTEAQLEIAVLQQRAQEINTTVLTEFVPKIQYIDRVERQVVREFVSVQADSRCEIPRGFVRLHDQIVEQVVIQPQESDNSVQNVVLSDIGETVKSNYQICHRNAEQLRQLQEWIRLQESNWNKE